MRVLRANPVLAIVMNNRMFIRTFAVVCALVAAGGAGLTADERSGRQGAGGVRHRSVPQRPVAGSDLPLGARSRDRSLYAAAWNNLGIAYEHEGMFDKARDAYERALDLEPNNMMIQQNYDLFREINDRINELDP